MYNPMVFEIGTYCKIGTYEHYSVSDNHSLKILRNLVQLRGQDVRSCNLKSLVRGHNTALSGSCENRIYLGIQLFRYLNVVLEIIVNKNNWRKDTIIFEK